MSLKLHSFLGGFRTNKVLAAAALAEVPVELIQATHQSIKDPEFLKKNPNGKVPVLETKDGSIYESNAIIRHIARINKSKHLYGSNEFQESQVDQWLDWAVSELDAPIITLILPVAGWAEFDKEKNKKAITDSMAALKILDNHLRVTNYIVGNNITIADVAIASLLVNPFKFLWEDKFRKNIPSVTKWFESIAQHAAFTQVWGKIRLCQKQMEVAHVEKPAQQAHPAKKDEKKQEAKPKAEKPKKNDDEDDEPVVKSEKSALDSLPPSSFNLFDFKTFYVNAPDKHEALKFFFDNFDSQGYSLYWVHYQKYAGEGTVLFTTNNMKNGFLQRLDHFRKYAFGVHGVYGEEPNLEIQGVWVWRGVGVPKEISELDSYEYHDWVKLDPTKAEDKKKITEYWTGLEEGSTVDGSRARDVGYFK